MPSNLHTHDLVLNLKRVQREHHLSPQDVYEQLEAAGKHVCINTIKKIFADGSENEHFRYRDTIEPIADVFKALYGNIDDAETDVIIADLAVKDELIARRERELEELREDSRRRIEYLKHQIELKDQRIDRLMSRVDVLLAQIQNLLDKLP
jgi:hypothetical protein